MNLPVLLGIFLYLATFASSRTVRQNQRAHFLGDGTNDVAVKILQSVKGEKQNFVFSPFGYSTILAILTEGARENTRNQLVSSLRLPEDTYAVRSTYKRILSDMMERDVMNKPQFQNWFYVYKNYTVEQSYKNVLKDNYLIDVKEVDQYDWDDDEDEISSSKPTEIEGTSEQPNQQIAMDEIEEEKNAETTTRRADDSVEKDKSKESSEKKGSKEKESEEEDSKEQQSAEDKSKEDESDEDSGEEKQKPSKKPSNVMKIKEKTKPAVDMKDKSEPASYTQEKPEEKPLDGNENVKKGSETVESVSTDRQVEEGVQTIDAKPDQDGSQSSAIDFRSRTKRDMASAISANKLVDKERQSTLRKISRMMAFNALYFQGNWTSKFSLKQEKMPFQLSATQKDMIQALHAEGEFETGRVPELDAWALDLPYQGERYSLLILVPAGEDGLDGLVQRLDGFSFYNIDRHLTKLPTKVCIPKLRFYTISKPKDAFIKSGITDLFTEEADLSGISGSKGLYLEELVQIVTFDIDENESSYNYLSTSDIADTRATPVNFSADQPFLFFLRDKVENLNIVTGMVKNPATYGLENE